jgi:hypothetical protein
MIGCAGPDEPSDDSQLSQAPTIQPGSFKVSADPNRRVLNQPITITTTCLPRVTGKGVIGITGARWKNLFDWVLLAPIADTVLMADDVHYTIHIPAEFQADQLFTQKWTIQLLPRTGPAGEHYTMGAHVYIDSIFIADSNRMYWIKSDVARRHCPRHLGWQPHAMNDNTLYL